MQIELNSLMKEYNSADGLSKIRAVDGISLSIPSNQIFGIIGKSGAGKSSLVRLISMMEHPDSGEVLYDGQRVDNLPEKELVLRRRRIGMIFQNFNLFSSRSAGQNIAYPMEICGVPKDQIEKRVNELLEIVELSDRKDARISTVSGGQKQRIAIARALANKPDILFCDEATSALDPQTTTSILNLIRKIQSQMNLTVVMITHQMEVVRDACEYVSVLNDGMVVESGTVKEIFSNPKSEVTKDFLSHLTSNEDESNKFVRWSDNGGKYIMRFVGNKTGEPVISDVSKKFDVEINILAGGIQRLRETDDVGTLIVDITGKEDEVKRALEYIKEKGVTVELAETAGEEKC